MGELAAGVAHEIRNPLNAISMSVQRLGREFPPADGQAEQLALIKTIRKEIARIGEIIQQFLRFARPAPLQKTSIDFNDLVQKVVDLYQAKLLNYGITFKWSRTHPLKTFVDPEQLERAIINLLENAIAATQPGSIIEFQMIDDDQQLRFLVRDSGMGIPPENLSRIFDLYFTTKPNGTGLGLPQVYQVIVEHGGSVVVDSTPGVGTTFTIFLPRNRE
jgi:signal transduction histidine kinase